MNPLDPIGDRARTLFERASERTDAAALARLRQARQQALAGPEARRTGAAGHRLVPVGAFAAAVLALGLAWWLPGRDTAGSLPATDAATLAEAPLDEDPELYAWLAEAPVATGPRSAP